MTVTLVSGQLCVLEGDRVGIITSPTGMNNCCLIVEKGMISSVIKEDIVSILFIFLRVFVY